MKHLLTLFLIPFFLLSYFNQKENIVGKWIGDDQNEVGYVIFDADGYAAFEINGKVLGGKEFTMNGKKGKMTYTINHNTTPIEIDFTLTKTESGETKNILGIAEFTGKDIMKFNMSFDAERPSEFNENSIILKRVN